MNGKGPAVPPLKLRVNREGVAPVAPADTSGVFTALSQSLRQVGSVLNERAVRAAQREGLADGSQAGIDPEFATRTDGTAYSEAFNRAGLRSLSAATETRLTRGLAEAYDSAPEDAAAFNARAEALRAEFVDPLPAELQPQIAQTFQRMKLGYDRDYARLEDRRLTEQARADALPLVQERQTALGRLAYQGGLDETANGAIEAEAARLVATLAEYGPKGEFELGGQVFGADPSRGGVFSVDEIQAEVMALAETVGMNRVKGTFDRLGSPGARATFMAEFKADFAGPGEITGRFDLATVEALERYMAAQVRADEQALRTAQAERDAALREQRAIVRDRIGDYRDFASNGLSPDANEMGQLRAMAEALGEPDMVADIDRIMTASAIVTEVQKRPPAETQAYVNQLRASLEGGATPEAAMMLEAAERGLTLTRQGLARDPVGFAVSHGLVSDLPLVLPGEETGIDEVAQNVATRRVRQRGIEARFGEPGSLYTADEKAALSRMERESPGVLAEYAAGILRGAEGDGVRVLAEISGDAPLLAGMGAILEAGGSVQAVNDAARGLQIKADNPGVATGLSATTSGAVAQRVLGGLDQVPEARARVQRLADAIYLGRVGLGQEFDEDQYGRALQEAAGASYRRGVQFGGLATNNPDGWWNNRGDVLVPSWMRADSFSDVVSSLRMEDFEAAGGVPRDSFGEPLSVKTLRTARLVSVGHGRYLLNVGSDAQPRYVAGDGPNGEYELDLARIRDRVAERFPEAVAP